MISSPPPLGAALNYIPIVHLCTYKQILHNLFNFFQCLNKFNTYNARSCIPRQWVCDLQDDCPHGEDETVTSCLGMDHPTFNGLETDIEDF